MAPNRTEVPPSATLTGTAVMIVRTPGLPGAGTSSLMVKRKPDLMSANQERLAMLVSISSLWVEQVTLPPASASASDEKSSVCARALVSAGTQTAWLGSSTSAVWPIRSRLTRDRSRTPAW